MKPCLLCLQSCGAPKEKGDPEAWEPKGVRLGWDWGSPTPRVNLGPQYKRPRSAPMPSGTEVMLSHAGSNSALRFLDILINSTNMCGSLHTATSIVGDNPQPVEFLFCLSNRSFEWRICAFNAQLGKPRPRWGAFLQGWSTEQPGNIGISICKQLFWPLHPSPPLPGVVPGGSSTSQPNVPDVHCCNCSIFNSWTNEKILQNKNQKNKNKTPQKGKCQNNTPWNEGWKGLVESQWQELLVWDYRELNDHSRGDLYASWSLCTPIPMLWIISSFIDLSRIGLRPRLRGRKKNREI